MIKYDEGINSIILVGGYCSNQVLISEIKRQLSIFLFSICKMDKDIHIPIKIILLILINKINSQIKFQIF